MMSPVSEAWIFKEKQHLGVHQISVIHFPQGAAARRKSRVSNSGETGYQSTKNYPVNVLAHDNRLFEAADKDSCHGEDVMDSARSHGILMRLQKG